MQEPLYDRERELFSIDDLVERAWAGHGSAIAIAGAPGIGCSRLLEHACERASERGFTVLAARGVEHECGLPYGVARQALERSLGKRMRALLLGGAPSHAALLGLHATLMALAARAPTLIAVDDAHWADECSLRWLAFTALRSRDVRVALVVASHSRRSLAELIEGGAREVEPGPLGAPAIAELLRSRTGRDPAAELVRACRVATGGNPFLACELAGALRRGDGPSASPRLERFVARRLGTLTAEARRLAEAVSLLGPPAELRDAAALAGLRREPAAAAADALHASGLLAPGTALRFAQPLVAETVYATLPAGRRALMHSRAARLSGDGSAAARHLLASPAGADPWAAAVLRREGERALERGATTGAVALLRRAAREAVGDGRGELLAALGLAEARLGSPAAVRHLRAARRLSPAPAIEPELVRSLLAHGRAREAFALAGSAPRAARPRLEAELYAGARLVPGLGARVAARPSRPSGCEAAELVCRGVAAARAVELASATAGADADFAAACHALIWCDRYAEARRRLERAASEARRAGAVASCARIAALRAELELRAGALTAADEQARRAGGRALPWLALALLERGEPERAASLLAPANVEAAAAVRFARARVRLASHDLEGGLADLVQTGAILRRDRIPGPAVLPWRAEAAFALAASGDAVAAERLAREELRLARAFGAPRALGLALRALAASAGRAARLERLREAADVLAGSGARLDHALALCDLGGALRRHGARREAREPLRAALDTATRIGAAPLAARAREELSASGARPRRTAQSGRDALTPAELRVAGLAARGFANREIAQALYLTVKTIETELGHAYAKLGIHSRRELPRALEA